VDVAGKPAKGDNVTSKASADVQAQESKILVTKKPTLRWLPRLERHLHLFVNNTGSSVLQGVFVSDLLPTGMTYVSSFRRARMLAKRSPGPTSVHVIRPDKSLRS